MFEVVLKSEFDEIQQGNNSLNNEKIINLCNHYKVYSVTTNPEKSIMFLINDGWWDWKFANNFYPVE